MKYKKTMFDPAENILMLKSTNNDGNIPHSHEFVELVYVSSGKGVHSIKGRSYLVSAGDLFIISTQDDHALYPLSGSGTPFEWLNCIFLPDFITFDFSIFPPDCRYIGTHGFEMHDLFHAMMREFLEKKSGYLEILRSCLMIVLTRLARLIAETDTETRYSNRKRRNCLKKAEEYIRSNYQEDIRLKDIASQLGVSLSYTGKIFRELKGAGPMQYLERYRVEQSCRLLQESSFPVYRVAAESGFRDMKFFHTVFKRSMGMTPGEYRSKFK